MPVPVPMPVAVAAVAGRRRRPVVAVGWRAAAVARGGAVAVGRVAATVPAQG